MDNWQLQSQIQKTLAETGGKSPQSPITTAPITIKTTNIKTGKITTETIPTGTRVKTIEAQAKARLQATPRGQVADISTPAAGTSGTNITIPITQTELDSIAKAQAAGQCVGTMKTYYTVKTYKVALKDGGTILVEALDNKTAKQKAIDAGYKVAWVTRRFGNITEATTPTSTETDTIEVKDGNTGEILKFPKSDWDAWPDKYKNLVKTERFDAAMRKFKREYFECADGQFILKSEFGKLPTKYRDIAALRGWDAMQEAFEADYVKLGDGQWIAKNDWDTLVANDTAQGTNFAEIGKDKGYDAMVTAIDKANEPFEEFTRKVENGDIIPVAGGQYITKDEYDKLPTGAQQIVKEQGFEALESATSIHYEKITEPEPPLIGGINNPRFQRRLAEWESLPDKITPAEYADLTEYSKGLYSLPAPTIKRVAGLVLASFIPPTKATLPEYTMADITALDWGIAAAQAPLLVLGFAPAAITGSLVGKVIVTGVSTALGGMIGYETAKSWDGLTPGQRAMGVGMATLCAVPLITTVARNVKISGPAIPTTEGNAIAWKGLSVAGQPIIGKSGGKWVLGTRGITLPEAKLILNGYKPEMMLETKVFVNRTALEKAGFTKVQIDYLADTLKSRNLFAGKMSPWLDKNVLLEPTQRLNANEIDIIVRYLVKEGKSVKDAHLLYGSPTIKAQAAPELRDWRALHDWDISLNKNQTNTEVSAQTLLRDLRAKGGGLYKISPKSPTLIEKKIGGTWEHIADIHSQEAVVASASDIPGSKLDVTGDYSYGRMVSEPAITVKYPGVGELRIMRLSESGVRKADTILRVRQVSMETPKDRYIATGGYEYGQELVNSLAATYDIKSVPVEKFSFWTRLKGLLTRSKIEAESVKLGDDWINLATAQIELAPSLEKQGWAFSRVAVHELTHHQLISNGIVFNKDVLGFLSNKPTYKPTFDFIKSLSTPELRAMAQNIGDEFLCIKLVKKMSGWYQGGYIDLLKTQLAKMGATDVEINSMLKLSQSYVDTIKVPRQILIDTAFTNFLQGTTPRYSNIFKPTTAFRPPERGIAQPGVPKDAADFYVTVRTLCGEAVAEEWLESWAKAMGYSKAQLKTVLPKIRQSMLDVAANTPSDIIGYEFKPASSARIASGASPAVIVHVPSSLGASVSPKLEGQISKPIYPYKLSQSPSIRTSTSLALASMLSKSPRIMASLAKTPSATARSITSGKVSPSPSPSPVISKVPSPSAKPSVSPIPSISPSGKPSQSKKPSKAPSSIPSPKPSPIPSPTPTPSPKPSPYPYPYPKPGPKPKPIPRLSMPSGPKQKKIHEGPALAVWKQGAYWVSIFPPFRTTGRKEDVVYSRKRPKWGTVIARGRHSPRVTLRSIGKVPQLITVPMGVVTARIRNGRHLSFSRSNGRKRGRVLY